MKRRVRHLRLRDFMRAPHRFHFGRAEFAPVPPAELHDHDFHEIFWIEEGEGWHHLGTARRPLRAGMLVLVQARDRHGFSGQAGAPMRLANVAFPRLHWERLWRRYCPGQPDPMGAAAARREFVDSRLMAQLRHLATHLATSTFSMAVLDGFLLAVFEACRCRPNKLRRIPAAPDWLRAACRDMTEPARLAGGLRTFYRLAGRSADHVARVCRRNFDLRPTDLINNIRLDRAAHLLACGDETIIEIAHECGLPNLSHFYRLFAKRFGTTPRRYRVQSRLITGRL